MALEQQLILYYTNEAKRFKAVKPSAALAQRSPTDETGIIFKEPIFGRKFGSRKYRNTLERELSDFSQAATTNYQKD